jgi:hypothetical protein
VRQCAGLSGEIQMSMQRGCYKECKRLPAQV